MTFDESFDLHCDVRLTRRHLAVIDLSLALAMHDLMRRRGPMTGLEIRRGLGLPRGARTTLTRIANAYCRRLDPSDCGAGARQIRWCCPFA